MGDDNFGLTEVVPENTIAWWGARCNYDRQAYWGPGLDISMHLNAWHGEEGDIKRLKYYWMEARKAVFGASQGCTSCMRTTPSRWPVRQEATISMCQRG